MFVTVDLGKIFENILNHCLCLSLISDTHKKNVLKCHLGILSFPKNEPILKTRFLNIIQ